MVRTVGSVRAPCLEVHDAGLDGAGVVVEAEETTRGQGRRNLVGRGGEGRGAWCFSHPNVCISISGCVQHYFGTDGFFLKEETSKRKKRKDAKREQK